MLEWKSSLTQQVLLPMIILFFSGKKQCQKKLTISKISAYKTKRYAYFVRKASKGMSILSQSEMHHYAYRKTRMYGCIFLVSKKEQYIIKTVSVKY